MERAPISLLLVDGDWGRLNYHLPALEQAGFTVTPTSPRSLWQTLAQWRPQIVLLAPLGSKLETATLAAEIMERSPLPIVAIYDPQAPDAQVDVHWCGAMAVLPQPPPSSALDPHSAHWRELCQTLRLMHVVPPVRRRLTAPRPQPSSLAPARPPAPKLIAILSSTGGPQVLPAILGALPAPYPRPLILLQHLTLGFEETFCQMLSQQIQLPVQPIRSGQPLTPGVLQVACAQHVWLTEKGRWRAAPPERFPGYCPSGNLLLESLAKFRPQETVALILSGMGDDGARGLSLLHKRGGWSAVQDPATCIVDSMPRQALAQGAAEAILTPAQMGQLLASWE